MRKKSILVVATALILASAWGISTVVSSYLDARIEEDSKSYTPIVASHPPIEQLKKAAPQDAKEFLKQIKPGKYGDMILSAKVGTIHGFYSEVIVTVKKQDWRSLSDNTRISTIEAWIKQWETIHQRKAGKVSTVDENGKRLESVGG